MPALSIWSPRGIGRRRFGGGLVIWIYRVCECAVVGFMVMGLLCAAENSGGDRGLHLWVDEKIHGIVRQVQDTSI